MKRFITILTVLVMVLGSIGCGQSSEQTTQHPLEKPENTDVAEEGELPGMSFDEALISYVNANGWSEKNYMISPTSFRAALCLAIAGADGNTADELLNACGFSCIQEADLWYRSLVESEEAFTSQTKIDGTDAAFSIANSVWNNESVMGRFTEPYLDHVRDVYRAEAHTATEDTIVRDINEWCNEKTNGMIPRIVEDINDAAAVLVNALYLRSCWVNTFAEGNTHEDVFTNIDGTVTAATFMEQTEYMSLYRDEDTTTVVLPLYGDKYFVLVLGDAADIGSKIKKAEPTLVHLVMPKFETEATFESDDLCAFLRARGVSEAFDPEHADFTKMCEDACWYISDIIQKDRISVDENGLEAAAVTAIFLKNSTALPDQETPVDVIADHAFSYYIYSALYSGEPEILFYGQYVNAD